MPLQNDQFKTWKEVNGDAPKKEKIRALILQSSKAVLTKGAHSSTEAIDDSSKLDIRQKTRTTL